MTGDHDTAHWGYLAEVAAALKAGGLNAGDMEDSSDEWRSGFIRVATKPGQDPGDDAEDLFILCWDERYGWFSGWESQHDGIRFIEYLVSVLVPTPATVVKGVRERLSHTGGSWISDQPSWGHDPDEDGYDAQFAADVERTLAGYAERHP